MVWKHVVKHQMKTDEFINQDIIQDPTLPRTRGVTCAQAIWLHALVVRGRCLIVHPAVMDREWLTVWLCSADTKRLSMSRL